MKNYILAFVFFSGYFVGHGQILSQKDSLDKMAILQIMQDQQKAWNEGNIDKFMRGYWNSPKMVFVGKKGPTYGYKKTLEKYKNSYPSKEAMGHLTFEFISLKRLCEGYFHMIGKYTLIVGETFPSGHFTLIWKKIDGEWKIVTDHSS